MTAEADPQLKIFQLPPETIEPLWPSLREKLNPAIARSRGLINEQNTFEKLRDFKWQCWVAYRGTTLLAAIVTRILVAPSGKRLLDAILAGGEDGKSWQRPIVERLKQFMHEEDCQAFQLLGRRGWERVYPEFKVEQIVLEYRP